MDIFKILGTEIDNLNPLPAVNGTEKLPTGRTWTILYNYFSTT